MPLWLCKSLLCEAECLSSSLTHVTATLCFKSICLQQGTTFSLTTHREAQQSFCCIRHMSQQMRSLPSALRDRRTINRHAFSARTLQSQLCNNNRPVRRFIRMIDMPEFKKERTASPVWLNFPTGWNDLHRVGRTTTARQFDKRICLPNKSIGCDGIGRARMVTPMPVPAIPLIKLQTRLPLRNCCLDPAHIDTTGICARRCSATFVHKVAEGADSRAVIFGRMFTAAIWRQC